MAQKKQGKRELKSYKLKDKVKIPKMQAQETG